MTLKRIVSTLIITVFILALCGCEAMSNEEIDTSINSDYQETDESDSLIEDGNEEESKITILGVGGYDYTLSEEADLILMVFNDSYYGKVNGIDGIMDITIRLDDEELVDEIIGVDTNHDPNYYYFCIGDGWYTLEFESGSGAYKSRAVVMDETPQWVSVRYFETEDIAPKFMLQYSNEPIGYD